MHLGFKPTAPIMQNQCWQQFFIMQNEKIKKEHIRLKNEYKKYFTLSSNDYHGEKYIYECNKALEDLIKFEKKNNILD